LFFEALRAFPEAESIVSALRTACHSRPNEKIKTTKRLFFKRKPFRTNEWIDG
jgi:hypothetical protein